MSLDDEEEEEEEEEATPRLDDRLRRLINRRMPSKRRKPRKHRKTRDEREVDVTRLHELSETELVQVANRAGYPTVSRQLPREDIIDIILGVGDPPVDPLAPAREAIHSFVKANHIMVARMPCDLHCPSCTHHWVVECFGDNKDQLD